jgi:hypothetical protein
LEVELAWAAGFFDGEGCTSKRSSPQTGICIFIWQNDREVLDRFRNAVGVGKVYGPYSFPSQHGRVNHQYAIANGNSITVLDQLFPFLSSIKREQAIKAGYIPKEG